jgi:hypothetical protein
MRATAVVLGSVAFLFTSVAVLAADLPNPDITPGATFKVTKAKVCTPGYAASVRRVTSATKTAVFQAYGLTGNHTDYCQNDDKLGCEVDDLISLELGGSNDIKNLWPEPYGGTTWNAHVKDKLENKLHALVCDGTLSLKDAQQEIASDWIASYRKRIGEP